jgi:hypothetical protein
LNEERQNSSFSYPQIEGLGIYVLLVAHSSRDSDPLVGKLRDEKPFPSGLYDMIVLTIQMNVSKGWM